MNSKLLTGISLAIAVAGCASTPPSYPVLDAARSAVRTAVADPNVAKYAALDLQAAQNQLQLAETAALHRDAAAIDQPAYLATQNARLAELRGEAKADDARVAAGQTERDQIQLAARTREVATADSARNQQEEKAARLQAEIAALKARPTDRGLVLTLGDVLFDTGRAQLNPGAARNLDQLVTFLDENPRRHVEIDGYTDSVGTDSYNVDLSQRRADAVRAALVSQGIDPARIVTRGYGKEFAVASNAEPSGRQLNRRVEVVIGGDSGAPVASRGS
jgi:outer membrane protein OmpA-like peptidoglycan-associated protein